MFDVNKLKLYFIMGSQDVGDTNIALKILYHSLQDGVTMFQWREKKLKPDDKKYEEFAKECQELCKNFNVPFIVNDNVEFAIKINADGVHVGQDDLDAKKAREIIGDKILGVSAHNFKEISMAKQCGADYIGFGPIYETKSKLDAKEVTGLETLKIIKDKFIDLPIVAIGGIKLKDIKDVFKNGADGIAVISAITQNKNFVKDFYKIYDKLQK